MRVAAIDIGTNSVRLLVADGEIGRARFDSEAVLETVERHMRITRLGQGVDRARRLAPEAIDRTLEVVGEYASRLKALGATRMRATATSAARDAANRDDLFRPASELLGVTPELLSGEEEAALSFRGATAGLAEAAPFLVVDIGGGSTELVVGTRAPESSVSLDLGCVRITEQYLHSDPPAPEELSQAVSVARDMLADACRHLPGVTDGSTLVGLAGTITTVAAIELGLPEYDRSRVHHFRLTRAAAEDVFRTLATEPLARRRHNPGLEPERADVIVGGAVVLVALLRVLDVDDILVSESDILDGMARSLLDAPGNA